MKRSSEFLVVIAGAMVLASPLAAQGKDRDKGEKQIPPGHMPPPGLCRVWLKGVPPAQQPAPTDCASAVRNLPENARVIFSDERPLPAKLPPIRGFRDTRRDGTDDPPPAKPAPPERKPAPAKPAPDRKPDPAAPR